MGLSDRLALEALPACQGADEAFQYSTPTLQKPEGFRVKASEGEVVVLYFEPSATQNLKSSGFPEGETTWQNRPHPSNSPMEVSGNLSFCHDIGYNCGPLSNLCHVVYAAKGFIGGPVNQAKTSLEYIDFMILMFDEKLAGLDAKGFKTGWSAARPQGHPTCRFFHRQL